MTWPLVFILGGSAGSRAFYNEQSCFGWRFIHPGMAYGSKNQ
jgi:hypothetical protein